MEELYVEGVATHGGPESCVDGPRGRGEALTGVRVGRVIEPRKYRSGVPTLSQKVEGNTAVGVSASRRWALRGQRAMACAEPPCARTGRSHVRPSG